jgi:hypothetical protein
MKHLLIIIGFLFTTSLSAFAQDTDPDEGNERLPDKMNEFIQKQLKMTDDESKKFSPVFMRYFKDWRKTMRENRSDNLIRTQKVTELQIRYRTQFRDILGEERGGQVYTYQRLFVKELMDLQRAKRKASR